EQLVGTDGAERRAVANGCRGIDGDLDDASVGGGGNEKRAGEGGECYASARERGHDGLPPRLHCKSGNHYSSCSSNFDAFECSTWAFGSMPRMNSPRFGSNPVDSMSFSSWLICRLASSGSR